MKSIFISFMIFLSYQAYGAGLASENTVDQYVKVALAIDAAKLKGEGPISCKYAMKIGVIENEPEFQSFGKNQQEANQNLALVCIKERCQQVGQWIMKGLQQFDQVGDAENTEYLKTQGYTESQITNILQNRIQKDRSPIPKVTCETSSALGRMMVVDSCFSTPMLCNRIN